MMKDLAKIHGLSGPGVSRSQWESGNISVRFPFADDTGPEGYPFELVVDACVVIPGFETPSTETVAIGCLHVGPALVSAMVYAGNEPVLCCSVPKSRFTPFTPYPMRTVRPGCSGMITFGDVWFDLYRAPMVRRDMVPLSDSAVIRPVVGRLAKFIQPERGEEASGIVGLVVPDGVGIKMNEDGHVSTLSFSLSGVARDNVTVACDMSKTPLSMPVPVSSINGVRPDRLGRIAIVFAHDAKEVPA